MRYGWLVIALVSWMAAFAQAAPEDFAQQELDRYFKRMGVDEKSGAKNEVRIDPTLGDGKETYKIAMNEQGYVITGSNANVALTGVYHLLDNAGCRFLAPAFDFYKGSAEIVPAHTGVVTFAGSMMSSPALKYRKLYVEEGRSHTAENLAQLVDWMPKVGFNTLVVPTNYQGHDKVKWDNFREKITPECQKRGITIEVGGHGYQNFLNASMEAGKLFEQHADWFGRDESGKRSKAENRVFCTSNADAMNYLIANFIAYVKARPEIQIYDFWPPDGAKWCTCDTCAKLGTPSDRQAILMRQVQRRTKEARPDLKLEMIAYAAALQPPEHEKVDKDILVDFCPINQQFDREINDPAAAKNKEYLDALLAWRKAFDGDLSIYSYFRKYAWNSLPVIIPHYMQRNLHWYAKFPTQGVSSYSEPGDWGTYELNHYVLGQLAWNPEFDVDVLVKKFCAARYGPFADEAQQALLALQNVTRNTGSVKNSSLKPAAKIEADYALLKARLRVVTDSAVEAHEPAYQQSLKRLMLMCLYAMHDLEIQRLRATKAPEEQIAAKSEEVQAFLREHADEGVFIVKRPRAAAR